MGLKTILLPIFFWAANLITPFSIPLFGVGLHRLFGVMKGESKNVEHDLNIITVTWGLLVLALLSGVTGSFYVY